ncbi:MAG: HD domain-containing phosphohydrolase, partial [Isosphaeraceae bacterium]
LQEMWIDDAAGDHSQAELSVVCKDGTPISIETSYMNMRDAAGRITARIGVSRDIAERKHAQERERQQMQRLLALREIDAAITSSFDQRFTLSMLLTQVTTSLGVDAADVLMLDPFLNTLDFVAGRGFEELPGHIAVPLTAYHAGEAARERRILIESDLQRSERPFARKAMITRERFKAYCVVPLVAKGEIKGVLEVFHRSVLAPDSEWLDFLETLARQAAIAIDNSQLFEGLQRSNFELALAYDGTIEGWSRALDLRDKETEGHTQRVTALTVALARRLKFADKDIVHIRRGGLLHDIGKMGVPDAILLKPGPLTDEEWVAMKKHPIFAFELLSPIRYLKSAAIDIPYCHHEKWDGTGYPRGLKGEQIPLSARIFSVVDVWDALTSDRPYRPAWPREKVLEHVRSLSGSHFDPMVVQEFLAMIIQGK